MAAKGDDLDAVSICHLSCSWHHCRAVAAAVFVGIDRRGFCFWRLLPIVTLLPAMDAFDEDGLRSICSDFLTRSAAKAARRSLQWFLAPNLAACSIVHPPLFDDSRRSSSLKCFVSKFLLKVPLSLFSPFYAPSSG